MTLLVLNNWAQINRLVKIKLEPKFEKKYPYFYADTVDPETTSIFVGFTVVKMPANR